MKDISVIFIFLGLLFLTIGTVLYFFPNSLPFGKLPGDVHVKGENYSVHFPLVSCLVISIVLTLLLNFFFRSK